MALVGASVALAGAAPAASAHPMWLDYSAHFPAPPSMTACETTPPFDAPCYSPLQLRQAYDMNPLYAAGLTGAGRTIVLVNPYGSPTLAQDLHTFDAAYGLPDPPSLRIVTPAGPVPTFDPTDPNQAGSAVETTIDVEMAHAMAPGANIVVAETPVAETEGLTGFPQIVQAENWVIDHHIGDVISQSFGSPEQDFPNPQAILGLRSAFVNAAANDVSVLAAGSDTGPTDDNLAETDLFTTPVVDWPSSDPLVTSVGGTQLHLDQYGNRTAPDNVWNDTAFLTNIFGSPTPAAGDGGLSSVFSRPGYQNGVSGVVGDQRGIPDVAMSAAVDGAALIYWSFDSSAAGIDPGWNPIGGTSVATPLFAGIVAIADQAAGHDLGLLNPALYAGGDGPGSGLVDITRGNNTVSFVNSDGNTYTVKGWNAVPGYDLASGLGTPDGVRLVAELARSSY